MQSNTTRTMKTPSKSLYIATAPAVTIESLQSASEFWHRSFRNADETPVRCRKTGKLKTWKTRPGQFKQPVKYGLRESFYLTPENAQDWVVAP